MSILKQPQQTPAPLKGKKQPQPAAKPTYIRHDPDAIPEPDLNVGLSGIEQELAALANSVRSYAAHAYDGENKMQLSTDPDGYPAKVQLESEAFERIATAFERIATVLEVKAGN